jgi:branched-chain amino acid transport system permease protein
MTNRVSAALVQTLNRGLLPYLLILTHIGLGSGLVYFAPRSNLAFLVLISSLFTLYALQTSRRFKIITGLLLALLIIPVIGVRNIFYLEVIFQISVFAALALGLNIVVGFAGLLDLGYVAFYAVGAYLWAFFGSQQYFVLSFAPGTQPSNLPFLLPGDAFYLFLFIAIIIAALTGILLGLPVLRLRGDYLAIVTLGFGEVIRVLANNLGGRRVQSVVWTGCRASHQSGRHVQCLLLPDGPAGNRGHHPGHQAAG